MAEKGNFNDYRFAGLSWRKQSAKYLTMKRVSDDKKKIVVKVAESHLKKTKDGYMLILDATHVLFQKSWAVDINYFGCEVVLDKDFFHPKELGDFSDRFGENKEVLKWEHWLETAQMQDAYRDVDGVQLNPVKWRI